MLDASATPLPAMSNAVPWSTDGADDRQPQRDVHRAPNASSFTGISPWS
jgi:hypothetical protein